MNAAAALLFSTFFALAATNDYETLESYYPEVAKVKLVFSSREYYFKPETRNFPLVFTHFDLPKAYSAERETVVYFQGLLKEDQNIYDQQNQTFAAYLKNYDCNVIVVLWNELIKSDSTPFKIKVVALILGQLMGKLLIYIKFFHGGTTLRVVGFDSGTMAAESFTETTHSLFPTKYFTALDPKAIGKMFHSDYKYLSKMVNLVHVVHSSGLNRALADRDYYINDGNGDKGPKGSWQSYLAYFLAMTYNFANPEVTFCPSWENFKDGKCKNNDKVKLYNDEPRSNHQRGKYFYELD